MFSIYVQHISAATKNPMWMPQILTHRHRALKSGNKLLLLFTFTQTLSCSAFPQSTAQNGGMEEEWLDQ